ncbi:hypothetical protein BT63DRAFT_427672 [Microthyrium microscopicum]|uniref:dolichol kinase n=1 Tax=Microthyrium microscopicum TaxID=703497 RepID=A0A6A6U3N3_9PEZI|nr:hypothetical protein BT63DRAFT_427672 [Microthyrium microscopicum]
MANIQDDGPESLSSSVHLPSRFPQPYARHHADLIAPTSSLPPSAHTTNMAGNAIQNGGVEKQDTRALDRRKALSPSESGTEADDESFTFVRALPAPPTKPRKGLRGARDDDEDDLTPTVLDREVIRLSDLGIPEPGARDPSPDIEDEKVLRTKGVRRRRAEILRRTTEGALIVISGALVLFYQKIWWQLSKPEKIACIFHAFVLACIYALYPLRLIKYSWLQSGFKWNTWSCVRLSAGFDPAPYIYPTVLPCIVALALFPNMTTALIPNLVLGLSAVPPHVLSRLPPKISSGMGHWVVSMIPMVIFQHFQLPLGYEELHWLAPEVTAALYPLHMTLTTVLHSFTTTSLLPAEVHLLSIVLINLLLLSTSPQAQILSSILWIGGLGILILCSSVIRWGVALARIPRWRLRRAGRIVQARQSFIKALNEGLNKKTRRRSRDIVQSDADDDDELLKHPKPTGLDTLKQEVLGALSNFFPIEHDESLSAVEKPNSNPFGQNESPLRQSRRRRNTVPANPNHGSGSSTNKNRRRRARSLDASFFLSLTPAQASLRTKMYAGFIYITIITLILFPIRLAVSRALGSEPFGWAIGYLFGDLRDLRLWVVTHNFTTWIPLPPLPTSSLSPANIRLLLAGYAASTVIAGLLIVLHLPAAVEVDTRRKVFHGTTVAMLLPSIPIDAPFFSLALALVLTGFCLLDLVRAAQLPPFSRPIALFLAPYVDGRDNRGPVVVSHMFLLVGCAVPLWLGLAATQLAGTGIWHGWVLRPADVSVDMLAGVVCVGMGDAAASLVGRRFGRHKWAWAGGKSLEGSVAFAGAVVLGLAFARCWIWVVSGWTDYTGLLEVWALAWKSVIAATGASLMEAVLTGGNDNVVVPVFLWVLVRALRM